MTEIVKSYVKFSGRFLTAFDFNINLTEAGIKGFASQRNWIEDNLWLLVVKETYILMKYHF